MTVRTRDAGALVGAAVPGAQSGAGRGIGAARRRTCCRGFRRRRRVCAAGGHLARRDLAHGGADAAAARRPARHARRGARSCRRRGAGSRCSRRCCTPARPQPSASTWCRLAQASGLSAHRPRGWRCPSGWARRSRVRRFAAVLADRVNYLRDVRDHDRGLSDRSGSITRCRAPRPTPFVAMTAFSGVVAMFVSPFLLPMLINADTDSRRAALQAPAAQLLSGGLGPFAAACRGGVWAA